MAMILECISSNQLIIEAGVRETAWFAQGYWRLKGNREGQPQSGFTSLVKFLISTSPQTMSSLHSGTYSLVVINEADRPVPNLYRGDWIRSGTRYRCRLFRIHASVHQEPLLYDQR
jgi:hypothetical protein